MGRLTFAWDLWLGGLCTGIQVIDPKLSHSFRPVLVEHLKHSINYTMLVQFPAKVVKPSLRFEWFGFADYLEYVRIS